jgi:serine/threonine protein kinase
MNIDHSLVQDIAQENILMNMLGVEQIDSNHARTLRLNFPLRYGIIDFGQSRRFDPERDTAPYLADVYVGRPTKAPELDLNTPYDPFAADVYQTGSMLLSLLWVRLFLIIIMHSNLASPSDCEYFF